MTRTPIMAGNWKMNVDHVAAVSLVQRLAWTLKDAKHDTSSVEVVVVPPFTDLRSVQTLVEGDQLDLAYGAQDVSAHASGAYTGEVAASFLSRLGVSYVVIGHSERREHHHEDDALVAAKAAATLGAGMVPIVCVGEPLEVRREGRQVEHVLAQVDGSLAGLGEHVLDQVDGSLAGLPAGTGEGSVGTVVIAYEPVWAIGTGEVATPDDAQEVCAAIRARLAEVHGQEVADAVRVLYGGSVKSSNVAALMTRPDVDGALVGGASLDADEFAAIARYQSHTTA